MAEIEEKIMNSEIVDGRQGDGDTVAFGCCIVLKNLDTDEDVIYTLVGPYESDIQKGRISMSSPLGRALLGKGVGDEVAFKAPGGNRIYEIVRIE